MSEERKIVECKGCGAKIFFEHGVPWYAKPVPILVTHVDGVPMGNVSIKQTGFVSHFVNCPKANDFSRSKKP